MRPLLAALAVHSLLSAASLASQEPAAADTTKRAGLTVYLDCQNVYCDFDFIRTDITAVNWVRDRAVSDVHILVTGQDTGGGGREFTATFIGLRQFAGLVDTLVQVLPPNFTDDERRKMFTKLFRAGLVRYVARTPAFDKVTITLGAAGSAAGQTSTKADPWKAWVFRLGMNGFTSGEETYKYYNVSGNFTADRVTKEWKTQFRANQNYTEDRFEIDDTTTAINIRKNWSGRVLQVKALGEHWSAGVRAQINSSTYSNYKQVVRVMPAVEYDVFPYSQSTRRQLMLEGNLGYGDFAYRDTTIFDKVNETIPFARLQLNMSQNEPWGSVYVGVSGIRYLNDRKEYRISSFTEFNIRLFKGFNMNFFGGYDDIHDQFALAKKNYTAQEILLRQFQRGTTYSFFGGGGFSYTFGSIFNNVVNPRFTGGFVD